MRRPPGSPVRLMRCVRANYTCPYFIPALRRLSHVILTQVRTHTGQGRSPVYRGLGFRRDDVFLLMLSPAPPPWRILQLFRSHGRRELSHWRRSGAWSSSAQGFDSPSSGEATGEEGGTKARPLNPLRFRGRARKGSEQISTCGTSRMSHSTTPSTPAFAGVPHTSHSRGDPLKLPAASRVEIFVHPPTKSAPGKPGALFNPMPGLEPSSGNDQP